MARRFDDRERWYPPSKPRKVTGGLKARTPRGAIGSTWWSQRFVAVLESFALGSRLTRGRTYARQGQVLSLEVGSGLVRSRVQGSRAQPYEVRIGLAPFGELVWAKAEIALSEQALPAAKLLAGEVPPELEEIFAAAGSPLFPGSVEELEQDCSCPDWGLPCKHLAATFYLLAEAFDDDPFLILRWRGRERDQLLSRLRELRGDRSGTPSGDEPTTGSPRAAIGTAMALDTPIEPTAAEAVSIDGERFWQPPPALPQPPPTLSVDPCLILRQLPTPSGGLGGDRLVVALREAYDRFAADRGEG
ncbi:SWIM zinc finger family protein [Microlunatus ginsengisoli]|uniref:SWIM zinc finger family protein n=1 Tax=Microlunatus ginsengisoli TaxID=363863 RepID=A0ABP7A946_9ACTN